MDGIHPEIRRLPSFFYALCSTFCIGIFLVKYRIEYVLGMPFMFFLFAYYVMMAFDEDSAVQKPEKYSSQIISDTFCLLYIVHQILL